VKKIKKIEKIEKVEIKKVEKERFYSPEENKLIVISI